MEDDLISKKDLLEITNISYGQLYRWKRKGLIPEDWFIRKSTFTGQETFFPRNQILSRIDKINNMKEDVSLDDLADLFSPTLNNISLKAAEMTQRNIVSQDVLKIYLDFRGEEVQSFDFSDILSAFLLNKLITSGDIGLEEGRQLLEVLKEGMIMFKSEPSEVVMIRKLGVFSCFLVSPPCKICLDKGARLIGKISIASVIEELKAKLI